MAVVAAAEDPSVSPGRHGLLEPFDSSVDVTAELVDTLIDPVDSMGPENQCLAGQMDHVSLNNYHFGGLEALWDHENDLLDRQVDPLGLENDHQSDQVDLVEEESHHPVG